MSHGLKTFNASGQIVLDSSDSICRVFGTIYLPAGTSDGSVYIPQFVGLRPWVFSLKEPQQGADRYISPSVWVSGASIIWQYTGGSFQNNGGTFAAVRIVYGAF